MVMLIQVAALLGKLPLNALFIFGAAGLGIPALGGPGCAVMYKLPSYRQL